MCVQIIESPNLRNYWSILRNSKKKRWYWRMHQNFDRCYRTNVHIWFVTLLSYGPHSEKLFEHTDQWSTKTFNDYILHLCVCMILPWESIISEKSNALSLSSTHPNPSEQQQEVNCELVFKTIRTYLFRNTRLFDDWCPTKHNSLLVKLTLLHEFMRFMSLHYTCVLRSVYI